MSTTEYDIVLNCENVSRSFGNTPVLVDINMKIARGESVAIVGSSGCGKSTLFNMILGTLSPTSGRVLISTMGGVREVDGPGPDRGIVFQKYNILPNLTALENVAFGLMLNETTIIGRKVGNVTRSWPELHKAHLVRAEEILVKFGLKDALHKYPGQLSGGMCQRVAVCRALVMEPEVVLLDEPFGALDEESRFEARQFVRMLYQENIREKRAGRKPKYTIITITHSLEEAVSIGDSVIGFSKWWNWQEQGYKTFPGATIVYDKVAPVFEHEDKESAGQIMLQADELRQIVFAGRNIDPKVHCQFWNQIAAGLATGVMQ